MLYLDIINLFLYILELLARKWFIKIFIIYLFI
jgi:hypothetical protein